MKYDRIDVKLIDEKLIKRHGELITLENIGIGESYNAEDLLNRKWIFTIKQIKNPELMQVLRCYNL